MIHSSYLSTRLIMVQTPLLRASLRRIRLLLRHFEYSPHSQVLAQPDAAHPRISKTGSDLLSLMRQAEHAPTNFGHPPETLIPSRLPRRSPSASPRLDDAPGGAVSPRIPRNPYKARIP